jgi:hypothetical protein
MAKFLSYRTPEHDEGYVNVEDISAIVACEDEEADGPQSDIWLRSDPDNCLTAVGKPVDILRGSIRDV